MRIMNQIINNILKSSSNYRTYRTVARRKIIKHEPDPQNVAEEKILKVAIIGMPNVGKSTIINNLMDRKVCATSSKVHTTRCRARAVYTEDKSQIVFLDTPGLVNLKEIKRFNLEKSFNKDSKSSLYEADVIGVMHDVGNVYTRTRLDMKIIRLLEENKKKNSFLVLNKIDMLKSKRKLLDITRLVTEGKLNGKTMPNSDVTSESNGDKGWPNFEQIFMVSALTGNGIDDIRSYLLSKAKPGKWEFPEDVWTDQKMEQVVLNAVKGKLLDFFKDEIPYAVKTEIEFFEINDQGVVSAVVLAKCATNRIAKLIAGGSDGKIRQVTECVQKDLQDAFQNFVRIKIVLEGPSIK